MGKQKIYNYVVVLKNHNKNAIEITGWLLSVLSILIFIVTIYQEPTDWGIFFSLFIIIAMMASNIVEKRKKKNIHFATLLVCTGIGLSFFAETGYVDSLFILAGIAEKYFNKNKEVGFSDDGFVMSGLITKKYQWSEMNNVLIKDDLLTLDFKNNKVFQDQTDDQDDDEYEVESDEFNAYCKEKLNLTRTPSSLT